MQKPYIDKSVKFVNCNVKFCVVMFQKNGKW